MCNGQCKDPDNTYDIADDPTDDLQHDLAMSLASVQGGTVLDIDAKIINDITAELERRGEPLPVNCRWEHAPYAPFGKKLRYDLEDKTESNRTVRCVLACENQQVKGTFLPVKVTCSEEDFDLGRHYEAADAWATSHGYEVFMVIDEVEMQPATVLNAFDWDIAPTIGADYTTSQ